MREKKNEEGQLWGPGGHTFFVQRCEGWLNVERMHTGQSDESRIARHVVIGGALIYCEDFGWPFGRRRKRQIGLSGSGNVFLFLDLDQGWFARKVCRDERSRPDLGDGGHGVRKGMREWKEEMVRRRERRTTRGIS